MSRRRLSRELGRSAMAAYWYINDKQELLELFARRFFCQRSLFGRAGTHGGHGSQRHGGPPAFDADNGFLFDGHTRWQYIPFNCFN